jgi:hypothetical protein
VARPLDDMGDGQLLMYWISGRGQPTSGGPPVRQQCATEYYIGARTAAES